MNEEQQDSAPTADGGAVSEAYDRIDRYLRNSLMDDDYAEYSEALETVYTHSAPAPDVARLVEADIAFTTDEVREAWKCLRTHNHSIPDECLDQMRDVLLTAAQQEEG